MKIKQLAIQHDFEIDIVATPVSIKEKAAIESMNLREITTNDLAKEFEHYFTDIIYLDSTAFSDGIHLIEPEKYSDTLRTMILSGAQTQ